MTHRMPAPVACTWTWFLWAVVMVSPGLARADGAADSKRLSAAASSDFRSGNFAAAEEKWEAAYKTFPDPNFLYALGRCYAADNKPDRAVAALREFLDKSPRTARRAEVQKVIKEQEAKLAGAAPAAPSPAPEPPPEPPPPVVVPVASPSVAAPAGGEREGGTLNRGLLKKWQLWAVVGGVVVVGAAVGVGVGLGLRGRDGFPEVGPGLSTSLVQF